MDLLSESKYIYNISTEINDFIMIRFNKQSNLYTFVFKDEESFGGGVNLSVLKKSLFILKNLAILNSKNKRNIFKFFLGIQYNTPFDMPFIYKEYYKDTHNFPNKGVLINEIYSLSPFKNILDKKYILLSAIHSNIYYEFGDLLHQFPPGILIYLSNPKIKISFLDYSDNYKEKNIDINLITYGKSNKEYDYLDTPLSGNL